MSSQALAANMLDASRMMTGGAPPAQAAPAPVDPLMALSQTSWMAPTPQAGLSIAPALPKLQPLPQQPLPALIQQPMPPMPQQLPQQQPQVLLQKQAPPK